MAGQSRPAMRAGIDAAATPRDVDRVLASAQLEACSSRHLQRGRSNSAPRREGGGCCRLRSPLQVLQPRPALAFGALPRAVVEHPEPFVLREREDFKVGVLGHGHQHGTRAAVLRDDDRPFVPQRADDLIEPSLHLADVLYPHRTNLVSSITGLLPLFLARAQLGHSPGDAIQTGDSPRSPPRTVASGCQDRWAPAEYLARRATE